MKHLLRELPPIHELQNNKQFLLIASQTQLPVEFITKYIQEEVNHLRQLLLNGTSPIEDKASILDYLVKKVQERTNRFQQKQLVRVINGTGTVLHTNLGRARLSKSAINHVVETAENYSNLEFNIDEGKRGSRHDIIESLLLEVTGAEAAMVVNNNAAAVFLILRAFAKNKEVIVSRGQLVEIGGSFRISSIMEESGAKLVEVGTTNKTHLYDYENSITDETALVLKVHTSNFKTIGFTKSVETEELVSLARKHEHVLFYEDLGSGSLFDFKKYNVGEEPLVREVIESGVDLVSFSGDKLLGGPQAGIIVGKKELIQKLKKHQLARVLRVDKMTLAALEQTLRTYISEEEAMLELPTVRDIVKPLETINRQANNFRQKLLESTSNFNVSVEEETSQIGGGTMPGVELPTYVASVTHTTFSAQELAEKLRNGTPAIVPRIKENKVMLDFRTIAEDETSDLVVAFTSI